MEIDTVFLDSSWERCVNVSAKDRSVFEAKNIPMDKNKKTVYPRILFC